jgi:hypothetical protein
MPVDIENKSLRLWGLGHVDSTEEEHRERRVNFAASYRLLQKFHKTKALNQDLAERRPSVSHSKTSIKLAGGNLQKGGPKNEGMSTEVHENTYRKIFRTDMSTELIQNK